MNLDFLTGIAVGLGVWAVLFEGSYRICRWWHKRRQRPSLKPEFSLTSKGEGVAWWKGGVYIIYRRMVGGEEALLAETKDVRQCYFLEPKSPSGDHGKCVLITLAAGQSFLEAAYGWYCSESMPGIIQEFIEESRKFLSSKEEAEH